MDKFRTYILGAWNSATIWFNTSFLVLLSLAMADPLLHSWLVKNNFWWVIVVSNLLLRIKTGESLEQKGKRGFWGNASKD